MPAARYLCMLASLHQSCVAKHIELRPTVLHTVQNHENQHWCVFHNKLCCDIAFCKLQVEGERKLPATPAPANSAKAAQEGSNDLRAHPAPWLIALWRLCIFWDG